MGDATEAAQAVRKWLSQWHLPSADGDALVALVEDLRTERLQCGHLAGELQGAPGGTRWCAGCEREAQARAEVVEAAGQSVLRRLLVLRKHFGEEDSRVEAAREFELTCAAKNIFESITPADYVGVRRADFEAMEELRSCLAEIHAQVVGECPSLLNEDSGGDANLDIRIRAVLGRAGKGE